MNYRSRPAAPDSNRRISDEVSARFGIRHESPQAILLKDGQPVWTGSHFRITAHQLDTLLQDS